VKSGGEPPRIFTPEYYDRMRELESGSWWNAGMRDIADMLLARVSLDRTGLLLDAGCGSGQSMQWFLRGRPGWSAVGVDVAREGLKSARAAGHAVCLASVLELPFARGSVDCVLTLDVLQHLPLVGGDSRALAEFARVLRPEGVLLIRTNSQSFPRTADDPASSFRKYELRPLREKLSGAGFEVIQSGRANTFPGLAEIPRELFARRGHASGYHGLLSQPRQENSLPHAAKRAWLRLEGRALANGWQMPWGRTIFALCRKC